MGVSKSTIALLMIIVGIAGVYGVSDDFCQGKDPNGYYADPDNCAGFMRCPPGYDNPTHQNCAPGTLWEPQTSDSGSCNHADQVDCGERPISGFCNDGWTFFSKNCYLFASSPRLNWQDAKAACSNQGAQLVKIENSLENDFIKKNCNEDTWIGLYRNSDGNFVWLDGTKPSFTDWAPTDPDNWRGNQDCGQIWSSRENQWDDVSCDGPRAYVCEQGQMK